MREDRIQHDLIMWFGQEWPEYRELLFMVHNETTSKAQGSKLKSMGLVAGVSDLILVIPNFGTIVGIELKAPESTHKSEHINRQLAWGEKVIKNGGFYLMTSNLDNTKKFIWSLIEEMHNFHQTAFDIQNDNLKYIKERLILKTIKF